MNEILFKPSKSEMVKDGLIEEVVRGEASMNGLMENKIITLKQERKIAVWSKFVKVSLIALFCVIVMIVLVSIDLLELLAFIDQNHNLAFIFSFLLIFLIGLTFIPTIPFTVFISVLIGPFPAMIITTMAETLTAFLHYQIGKKVGDVVNFEEKRAGLPFKLGRLPVTSPLFLLIGRAVPGGPKGLSFVCGAYCVPLFLYLWTTFIANLLSAALVAFGGNGLIKL